MHGYYPLYPVADAGYGRYDTYHYCISKGMELYKKHNMWEKERSKAFMGNPFNRINFESPRGIDLRIQRSIQVGGAFGIIKEDMRFLRFTRTGIQGITNELNLIAIGYNLKKYHNKKHRMIQ